MGELDREAELRRLFDRVVELEGPARERFVAEVADELLRERLIALLLQDAGQTAMALRQPLVAGVAASRRVGRYELLRSLGSGGMGVVVLARQVEPVERLVAVKFVNDAEQGSEILQRFRAEQQALARMNHPGIARVLDGGATDEGVPYFVMEYVRGEPITAYCDRRRLSISQRIRLLAMVCDAMQHAHQKGVIHRDLKPGNLLVAEDAGQPQPKVIDFGVARAVAGQLVTKAPTLPGQVVGTLLYMSPEQAAPDLQDLDTRTDIYSLGVLLFELLVGRTPLLLGTDPASLLKFREDLAAGRVPTAGSAATQMDADAAAAQARLRAATAADWRRQLAGDIGWIVGKALEGDRNRRYASASELAADLRRYLAGESVSARAPTFGYVAWRFVHRHRGAVLAVAMVTVAVVGGAVAATFGMVSARAARDDEAAARQRLAAVVERQRAVDEFSQLVQLYGDPGLSAAAFSFRQALAVVTPMIGVRWGGKPQEEAAVRAALGRTLLRLGEPAPAKAQLRQAWDQVERQGEDDPAWTLEVLADLRRAEHQSNDLAASRQHLARMLTFGAIVARAEAAELAAVLTQLAGEASPSPERAGAFVVLCDRAIGLLRASALPGRSWRLVGELLFGLALTAREDGVPGTDALLQRMEDIARQTYGEDVEFTMVLAQLAENRWRMGHAREALGVANELLASLTRLDLSAHWLAAQASRIRGLSLVATGEVASGETELLLLRDRMLPFRASGNAQVRAAIDALPELCHSMVEPQRLDEYLRGSFARWAGALEPAGLPAMWWPAAADETATPRLFTAALAVVEKAGSPPAASLPAGFAEALRGALLLRLGQAAAALPLLEAAATGAVRPRPECLADLVVVRRRTGDGEAADQALARLRQLAESATEGRVRWQLAVERATAARH